MTSINCHSEMTGYHGKKVTLSKSQQDDMRKRRNAGRTRLENGLTLNNYPQPRVKASQGSYQMRTMVQDDDCEFDIDDGVYFDQEDLADDNGKKLTPKEARERVCEALKWDGRLKHEAEVKRNCVRQNYPQGYHIDVPVYRIVTTKRDNGEKVEHYELASGDEWIKSDARAVTRWFNGMVGELNAGESDGSQMRRITKLTKKQARSRSEWKGRTTSGICITKLVTDHFVYVEGRDDQALRETWDCIKKSLEQSTQIEHPIQECANLADSEDAQVLFFCDCLSEALEELEVLDGSECDREQALNAWDKVFSTNYFSDQLESENQSKKSASLIVTDVGTARRNDGGGRFG